MNQILQISGNDLTLNSVHYIFAASEKMPKMTDLAEVDSQLVCDPDDKKNKCKGWCFLSQIPSAICLFWPRNYTFKLTTKICIFVSSMIFIKHQKCILGFLKHQTKMYFRWQKICYSEGLDNSSNRTRHCSIASTEDKVQRRSTDYRRSAKYKGKGNVVVVQQWKQPLKYIEPS